MDTQFASSRTIKILVAGIVLFLIMAAVFFVLGREARLEKETEHSVGPGQEISEEERNIKIDYLPSASPDCLGTPPEITFSKEKKETFDGRTVYSFIMSIVLKEDLPSLGGREGEMLVSGVLEGKDQEWKPLVSLPKRMISPKGRELPYTVKIPVWEYSPDSFFLQQINSVRVSYSLDILGCAEISGYTKEINIK